MLAPVNSCYEQQGGALACNGEMFGADAPGHTWQLSFAHANLGSDAGFVPVPGDSPLMSMGDGQSAAQRGGKGKGNKGGGGNGGNGNGATATGTAATGTGTASSSSAPAEVAAETAAAETAAAETAAAETAAAETAAAETAAAKRWPRPGVTGVPAGLSGPDRATRGGAVEWAGTWAA